MKQSIVLRGLLVGGSVGLNLASTNLSLVINTQPSKASKMPALIPEYAMHARTLMQKATELAVNTILSINLNSQSEVPIYIEIAALHCLLSRTNNAEFLKSYEQWYLKIGERDFITFVPHLEEMHKKSNIKDYKELLKRIIVSHYQKGGPSPPPSGSLTKL